MRNEWIILLTVDKLRLSSKKSIARGKNNTDILMNNEISGMAD
jgi:hypothetical protein